MKSKEYYHCFNPGDLCRGQDGDMYVILRVENEEYEFVRLQDKHVNMLGYPPTTLKKGEIGRQHVSVFDKYNYLYQPK